MRGKLVSLVTIVVAFLMGGAVMYYFVEINEKNQMNSNYIVPTYTTGVIKCNNDITIDETGISTAVGEIYDATVTIQNYRNGKLASSGSGFIYKKDDSSGYIMTNHHVIENADKVVITFSNDDQVEGEVTGSDEYLDLAVVKVDASHVTQVAKLGNSEKVNLGDTIFTVGSPVGYEYRGSVTRGSLSGKNRMVEVSIASTNDFVMRVLQIDAAINPGNSGGPLVNINGEVIGINSLKLVEDEIEGMGFAIPIEYAMNYVDDLEKGKKLERPLIGISMLNVTDTYRLYQNGILLDDSIDSGVVVVSVSKNSGAEKAGLKKGDVILEVNGSKVSNAAYLKYELYKCNVGDTIEIRYMRNSKMATAKVTLTKIEEQKN